MNLKRSSPWQRLSNYKKALRDKSTVEVEIVDEQKRRAEEGERLAADAPVTYPTLREWAIEYRKIDDVAFSLARFKPLEGLYDDTHDQICVMKPAQVGVSEWAITYVLWAMLVAYKLWSQIAGVYKNGINVGYIFPTADALRDFAKERIAGVKHESTYLQEVFAEAEFDDVRLKQLRNSFLYLRGGWSTAGLLSFPADVLVLDEFDQMNQVAVELARKRLRQSVIRRQLAISTPTKPDEGIHALYQQSDQRKWEVLCAGCGEHHEMDYFRDVRATDSAEKAINVEWRDWKLWNNERLSRATWTVHCPQCQNVIERTGPGRWIVTNPGARWHGYHIPSLAFQAVHLEEMALLAVSENPSIKTEFYRSDLGIPFSPVDSRLQIADLLKLSDELPGRALPVDCDWKATVMGVDTGARWHYLISSIAVARNPKDLHAPWNNQRIIRAAGFVRAPDELTVLMNRYSVRACVIDAQGEPFATREWARKHKGKVWRAYYPAPSALAGKLFALGSSVERKLDTAAQTGRKSFLKKINTPAIETDIVQINRTMVMDAVYAQVVERKIMAPAAVTEDDEFQQHLIAPVRVITVDDDGQEHAKWQHVKPDHLYHAANYQLIAVQLIPRGLPGVFTGRSAKGWGAK